MKLRSHLRRWSRRLMSPIIASAILIPLVLVGCGPGTDALPPENEVALFQADRVELSLGECTLLRWEVLRGFGARLDGEIVPMAGEMEVCP